MSDALYLSLWYPNLRLAGLGEKLTAVLNEFAKYGGEERVYAVTVWPVSWHEAPVFQRVWGRAVLAGEPGEAPLLEIEPRAAVAEALELLHEDYAYEFQIGWNLWELEEQGQRDKGQATRDKEMQVLRSAQDDSLGGGRSSTDDDSRIWVRAPRLVRVTGFGPLFDEGAYEQDGHIKIDFGSDAPFLEEEAELDSTAARHMAENVRQLVDLTAAVEKASGATARLLWSELGESLAQRLAQRVNRILGQGN